MVKVPVKVAAAVYETAPAVTLSEGAPLGPEIMDTEAFAPSVTTMPGAGEIVAEPFLPVLITAPTGMVCPALTTTVLPAEVTTLTWPVMTVIGVAAQSEEAESAKKRAAPAKENRDFFDFIKLKLPETAFKQNDTVTMDFF